MEGKEEENTLIGVLFVRDIFREFVEKPPCFAAHV